MEYHKQQRARPAAMAYAPSNAQASPLMSNGFQQMQANFTSPSFGTQSRSITSPPAPPQPKSAISDNEPNNHLSSNDLQKEKECVQVTLYINSELLRESLRISASMDGTAEEKQRNPHYMACLQRLQMNLAYLASVADRSHKPQDPLLRRGPQNLLPPPTMPQLQNAYKRLRVLLHRDNEVLASLAQQGSYARGPVSDQFVAQSGGADYLPPSLHQQMSYNRSTQSPVSTVNGNSPMLARKSLSPGSLHATDVYPQTTSKGQQHPTLKQEKTDMAQSQQQQFLQQRQAQQQHYQLKQEQQAQYQRQPHLQFQQQQQQLQQPPPQQQRHGLRQQPPHLQNYYYNNPVAVPQQNRFSLQQPSPPSQHLVTPGAQYLENSSAETNGNYATQKNLTTSSAQSTAQAAAQNSAYNLRWQPTQGSSTFKVQPY